MTVKRKQIVMLKTHPGVRWVVTEVTNMGQAFWAYREGTSGNGLVCHKAENIDTGEDTDESNQITEGETSPLPETDRAKRRRALGAV